MSQGPALWLLGGGALIVSDAFWIVARRRWRGRALRAAGIVTALEGLPRRYGTAYAPTFQFATPDGKLWTVEAKSGTSPAAYRIGETVEVLYDPESPMGARINGFAGMWLMPSVLLAAGIVVFAIGLGIAFPQWA